jgi:hypothetical protein
VPFDIKLDDIPVSDLCSVILCYDSANENTLNSIRKKWHPHLEKILSKSLLKHGIFLLGLNFGPGPKDCPFNHKVALALRGMSLPASRSLTYHMLPATTPADLSQHKTLDDLLDVAISKVKESHGQVNTTVISALDESQRSKSVMLPSEQSVSKAPPEIEDIIREAAATSPKDEVKKEVPPVEAPKVETALVKKPEEKKLSPVKKKESDDEYEKDDFDAEFD